VQELGYEALLGNYDVLIVEKSHQVNKSRQSHPRQTDSYLYTRKLVRHVKGLETSQKPIHTDFGALDPSNLPAADGPIHGCLKRRI